MTVCGNGPELICIWKRGKIKAILPGPAGQTEKKMLLARLRTGRSFLPCPCFLHHTGGETEREFLITQKRQKSCFTPVSTRGRQERGEGPCGIKPISSSVSSVRWTFQTPPTTCPIFMSFLPSGRTQKTGNFSERRRMPAGNT